MQILLKLYFLLMLYINRMVKELDLDMDMEVRVLPTMRKPDGLAMSSRNIYLSPEGRRGRREKDQEKTTSTRLS